MAAEISDPESAGFLEAEREQLVQALAELQAAVSAEEPDRKLVTALVTRLHELVESHFSHEERAGYFPGVLERAPQLSRQAAALLDQHDELLEQLEKLRLLVRAGVEMQTWWARVESDLGQFAGQLLSHEQAERQMIAEAQAIAAQANK